MTGVRRDLQTDPTITWCHSRGKQGFITWPQATPTLSYVGRGAEASNYPHYNKLCTMCVCVSWEYWLAGSSGQQSPDIPHSSQVRFDWNVFVCPTKYNNVRQYQTVRFCYNT